MPWSRKRGVIKNVWGLGLDVLVLIFIVGMIARGCAVVLAPVDATLDRVANALSAVVGGDR